MAAETHSLPATAAVAAAAAAMDADTSPDYIPAEPGAGGPLLSAPDMEPAARRTKRKPTAAGEDGQRTAGPPDPADVLPPGGADGDADDMVRVVPVPKDSVLLQEDVWRPVRLCHLDKAAQLGLSPDRLEVWGTGGYASIRASHGAHEGCFYFEATVVHLGPSGGARIGWSTRRAELQAPVGYDAHGYGVRAASGEKVSGAVRSAYGPPFARPGAVLGCYLYLPPGGRALERGRGDVVIWKGEPYLVDRPEPPARPLPGSVIAFSVDGAFQGAAFSDVAEGTHYPTVSLFTLPGQSPPARVRLNFGPHFAHPPSADGWGALRGGGGGGEGGGGGGPLPHPRPASEMAGPRPDGM